MSREVRLSRRDETLVDLLIETGLSLNIAKTLVFLSKRDETTSVEIEKATRLRQPEVSIAMEELRRRRGVEKRDIKKGGRGRPVQADRLEVGFGGTIDMIPRADRSKIVEVVTNIRERRSHDGEATT